MGKKRYIEYDIMRILACFCVIMIHASVFGQDGGWADNLWGVLSRWAVPAFVMLSGMMILPKAAEISLKRLMIHRVFRMLIIYIVWSGVYSAYNVYVLDIVYAPTKLKTFLDGCFSGETHMWYLPMLAGLYLISPILGVLVQKLNKQWTLFWIGSMFFVSSIIPFIVKLNIPYVSTIVASINGYADIQFLGGWTLYFVLGYYIGQHTFTRKQKWMVYVAALLCLLYTLERTVVYMVFHGQSYGVLSYEYPNIVIMSIGIMLFFKEEVSRIPFGKRAKQAISMVSGWTLGIYLSHILLLKIWYAVGLDLSFAHPIVSIPLVSLVTLISCAGITVLIRLIPAAGKYIA